MRFAAALAALGFLSLSGPAPDEKAANFTLEDPAGRRTTLYDLKDAKAVVLVFLATECPMVSRYVNRLNGAHAACAGKGVAFLGINSNAPETADIVAAHARASGFPFPVLLDPDQRVAVALKVEVTPTAVVLDAAFNVRYRGAIDDNKAEDRVRVRYLADAIEAVLAGKEPSPATTPVTGCAIQRRAGPDRDAPITYANGVAEILNRRCVTCHRPGQVAPFGLGTVDQATRWARDIKRATQARTMPPWKPSNHHEFRDERWLSDEEIKTLGAWAAAGAPAGDPSKFPVPPKFPDGWLMGEPDAVLTTDEYEVSAQGSDEYRCFVLPTDFPEDRWVSGVEIRPGNYRVVHHIIAYVDTAGRADALDRNDPKPGYRSSGTGPGFLPSGEMSGWAPGNMPYSTPDGVGRLLRKGARIVLETHYHKNGRSEKDRTRIGLHFAKKPVRQPLEWATPLNFGFRIPPGEKRHEVTAKWRTKRDIRALSIMPHMHLIGREILAEAELPDGTKRTLIHIPDWDFNWQDTYHFKEPVALPKGTRILVTAYYDNSEENLNNPNRPPRPVTWGEQTTDEMCIVFLSYIRDLGENKD